MFKCFNKIQINYNILAYVLIPLMLSMTYLGLSIQNFALASLPSEIKNETKSENIEINSYALVPTNISVIPESLPAGNLYLSSILSNGTAMYTRNLTDELFPFQLDRWYQSIQFVPIYQDRNPNENLTINNLIIGELSDFDNFDELLNQARIYKDVPSNSTTILDLPNKDISFMEAEIIFPNGTSGIYYGLYDGNQQTDKSELKLYMKPETNPSSKVSVPAIEIKSYDLLYNVTFTLVCNDLYKLGYGRCVV
jgi:hypothetical protein